MKMPVWSDQQVERAVGKILQIGVLLAGAIVLLGGIVYLLVPTGVPPDYRDFDASRNALRSFAPVGEGLARFQGRAIIELGLLLLIATPVARVVFSILAFWLQRDRIYVAATCLVLAILLFSLFGGHF